MSPPLERGGGVEPLPIDPRPLPIEPPVDVGPDAPSFAAFDTQEEAQAALDAVNIAMGLPALGGADTWATVGALDDGGYGFMTNACVDTLPETCEAGPVVMEALTTCIANRAKGKLTSFASPLPVEEVPAP